MPQKQLDSVNMAIADIGAVDVTYPLPATYGPANFPIPPIYIACPTTYHDDRTGILTAVWGAGTMKLEERATDIRITESGIIWNWNAKHILADKFRLLGAVKLLSAVMVLFIALMVVIVVAVDGGIRELRTALYISTAAIGGFAVLTLAALAMLGNIFRYQFGVSDKSVYSRMFTGKLKDAATAIVVLAAIMENPQAMGEGIRARSDEYFEISYADMKKIDWYPDDCVIRFKGPWYSRPFYMNCPPHLYSQIEAKIRAGLKAAHNNNFPD